MKVKFCRALAVLFATLYACLAFRAGLHEHRLWLLGDCLVAALFIITAASAHKHVKTEQRRRRNGSA